MTLEQKTVEYWTLSLTARGKVTRSITVQEALDDSNKLLWNLNETRRLWRLTASLQDQIIKYGGCKAPKKKNRANVVAFTSQAR